MWVVTFKISKLLIVILNSQFVKIMYKMLKHFISGSCSMTVWIQNEHHDEGK